MGTVGFVTGKIDITSYDFGMTLPDLIRRWQYGWGLAKALDPAEDITGADSHAVALKVTLDLPGRFQEFVPLDAEHARYFAGVVARAAQPSWISVVGADPAAALTDFEAAGLRQISSDDSLMSIALADHPVHETTAGYTATTTIVEPSVFARTVGRGAQNKDISPIHVRLPQWHDRPAGADAVIQVSVTDSDGEPAAGGLMGVHGTDAIAHHITTEPDHRRRGLGSVVMSVLSRRAIRLGATTGMLVAAPMGQFLYQRLGWSDRAAFVTGALPAKDSP